MTQSAFLVVSDVKYTVSGSRVWARKTVASLPFISPLACGRSDGTPDRQAMSAPPTITSYRYVIQFGNNSMLVRQVMRSRRWWSPAQGDPGHAHSQVDYATRNCNPRKPGASVNFLWTQFKIKDFYEAMTKMQACRVTKNNETRLEVSVKGTIREPMVHNHFEGNAHICSKRGLCDSWTALFKSQGLDPFDTVPLTFVVRSATDAEFRNFEQAYAICAESHQCVWIVKPGDFSNRGTGIRIYNSIEDIRKRIQSKEKCWVIQKYLERPLLVNKRKFDIRAYCLVDLDMKGYYYEDAYLRTTSEEWNLNKLGDRFAHLNNDAVQKNGANYGKFESANKLNLDEFQKYLSSSGYNVSVEEDIVPQIKDRMRDCILASHQRLNPNNLTCFEVFGFDFMVDDSFSVWLIEVNTNPCLEQCNAFLSRIIPAMIDEAFSLTIDKLFPSRVATQDTPTTKWHVIFDANKDDGCVSSPGRPISDNAGIEAIIRGPLDPFRGKKTIVRTMPAPESTKEKDTEVKRGSTASRTDKGKNNPKNEKAEQQNADATKGRASRMAKRKKTDKKETGERESDNDAKKSPATRSERSSTSEKSDKVEQQKTGVAKKSPATRSVRSSTSEKSDKVEQQNDGVAKKRPSVYDATVVHNGRNRKSVQGSGAKKKVAPRSSKAKDTGRNGKVERESDEQQKCASAMSTAQDNGHNEKVEQDSDAQQNLRCCHA